MKLPKAFVKDSEVINVVIETPKDSSNKYSFDHETKLFKLSKILPQGLKFPGHFGFIPHTRGGDGDPLDVLVLMDSQSYPGCIIECKVIGIIKALQKEKDKKAVRNDRIVAIAKESKKHSSLKSLSKMDDYLMEELMNFFTSYNKLSNKQFKPLGTEDAGEALEIIKKSM